MAKVTHKLEILVDVAAPVAEINNVIHTFITLHPGKEAEILGAVKAEIDAYLEQVSEGAGGE
jgi:hypothetical protein